MLWQLAVETVIVLHLMALIFAYIHVCIGDILMFCFVWLADSITFYLNVHIN